MKKYFLEFKKMIEISLLSPIVQEQILMAKQGETIQFSYNGELFGDLTPLPPKKSQNR